MSYAYQTGHPARRVRGFTIVIVLHLALAWLVVSGTARRGLTLWTQPLQAQVIQEVIIPPPPPPPKEVKPIRTRQEPIPEPPPFVPPPDQPVPSVATVSIAAVDTPPPVPPPIAPPPAPVVAAPAPPARASTDIAVACPTQVPPEMPRRALLDGIQGLVRAQALIRDGTVQEVVILSGPRVFHAAVRAAMLQYRCSRDADRVLAVQEFNFLLQP